MTVLIDLANSGDQVAQNSLGAKLAQAGGSENERAALYWYLQAVEGGYVESMWNAATMLLKGEGGFKDEIFGHHLIRIAAEHGNNSACLYLSNCYAAGLEGFERDATLADKWNQAAWDLDNEEDFAEPIDVDKYLRLRPGKP